MKKILIILIFLSYNLSYSKDFGYGLDLGLGVSGTSADSIAKLIGAPGNLNKNVRLALRLGIYGNYTLNNYLDFFITTNYNYFSFQDYLNHYNQNTYYIFSVGNHLISFGSFLKFNIYKRFFFQIGQELFYRIYSTFKKREDSCLKYSSKEEGNETKYLKISKNFTKNFSNLFCCLSAGFGYDLEEYKTKISLNFGGSFNDFVSESYRKDFKNKIKKSEEREIYFDPLFYIILKIQYDLSKSFK
ncbi:MAG: hypothetical protein GY830_11090 [Bacteroidetes bacterium]|nr:hypothetical protein [Bacteroidota bacterium]